MEAEWDEIISSFIQMTYSSEVRMIMVGSGALNYYKYKVPSFGMDFWVDATSKNLNKIIAILKEMGPDKVNFPFPLQDRKQNISIQFFPSRQHLLFIPDFVVDKSFSWAYDDSQEISLRDNASVKWRVLALEDLIDFKSRSQNPHDYLDLQELKEIKGAEND
ncbi:hypothetical protein EI546_12285 [Aequorivita sp. H23M31]|uniref:Nucleotidyltransferase family protein n=1 Tax=Aequorivita ciconiae TaxID=2494375 RepID=A0A410G5E6_9FLAO|nr:hypothetical protein [Aequorivita sp. H23M31]QAA82451.1 hypothetical protein EI546_12285 [Aequorivita sp. H23M31]